MPRGRGDEPANPRRSVRYRQLPKTTRECWKNRRYMRRSLAPQAAALLISWVRSRMLLKWNRRVVVGSERVRAGRGCDLSLGHVRPYFPGGSYAINGRLRASVSLKSLDPVGRSPTGRAVVSLDRV